MQCLWLDRDTQRGSKQFFVTTCIATAVMGVLHRATLMTTMSMWGTGRVPELSADGYHYLSLARQLAHNATSSAEWLQAPFLSALTAGIANLTSSSVQDVAPLVALGCYWAAIMGLCWCFHRVVSAKVACLAALVSAFFPYFYVRSAPNWFDTDPIIVLCLAVVCGAVLALKNAFSARGKYRCLLVGAICLLWWTWGMAAIVVAVVICCMLPWLRVRGIVWILKAALGCALLLVNQNVWEWGAAHVQLLLTGHVENMAGIAELQPLSLNEFSALAPSGGLGWCIVCMGCIYGISTYGRPFVALVFPWLALGLLCFVNSRFALFLTPVAGLGTACFWLMVLHYFKIDKKWAAATVACLLLSSFVWNLHHARVEANLFSRPQVELLSALEGYGDMHTDRMLFSWWDTGYFAHYVTGLPVFIDGGRQNTIRIRILQYILSLQNSVTARNCMRFFAAHGVNGIFRLPAPLSKQALTDSSVAFEERLHWLSSLLRGRNKAEILLRSKGLSVRYWIPELFPENSQSLFLYLDEGLFQRTWWFRPSNIMTNFPVPTVRMVGMPLHGRKEIQMNGRATPVSMSITRSDAELSITTDSSVDGIAAVETGNEVLLLPHAMATSLAGRLLVFGRAQGFSPLVYKVGVGGVWQVQ
ncbi:hypothetical protein [Halodesulfovibrio sp.]|jgi:hypothetical protein|uniref:hypothetical protein n=1 Tax=Halodesulfovibrio sp. TaxID=1912772 RepID=UPI0025FD76FA|nr:hypothetical protein [Halodesulfovibrio sp.]MCT4535217.1 hypothetical protein [Halodesulfovibrio sp.]